MTTELNADVHWRSYLFYLIMKIEYRFSSFLMLCITKENGSVVCMNLEYTEPI